MPPPSPLPRPDLPSRASVHQLMGGDGPLAEELMALLAKEAPRLLQALMAALAADQVPDVGRQAHTLRGMLGNFGADAACQAAHEVEQICREGAAGTLAAACQRLAAEVQAVLRALA